MLIITCVLAQPVEKASRMDLSLELSILPENKVELSKIPENKLELSRIPDYTIELSRIPDNKDPCKEEPLQTHQNSNNNLPKGWL